MIRTIIPVLFCCLFAGNLLGQDTTVMVGQKVITLSPVILDKDFEVAAFINQIKSDSSFYKAFKNLRILNFSSINDIRMLDDEGNSKASLYSKTKQIRENNCRRMEVLQEQATGNFYTADHQYNYYTAQMYASLFFTDGSVCGEDNIVAGKEFSTAGKSGMEKHKEQLKTLFFNPGKKIKGIPFVSGKTAIYDDEMAEYYDMSIDMEVYNKTNCYVFKQKVKPGNEGDVVLDEMTTWFDDVTFEVVARSYVLSYSAAVYDFKVKMEVEMTHFGKYLVPSLIRYNGNWKAIFKKRERGVFTATLFDFK
ncbi:hypothetical protein ACQ33O_07855 [Ferruginibacter sp. SUN002]|uniref:hypothetical protein n=1 Tax=Ferruginibacter sp. SUN002 TaxID=2937789 RepID=UPI003D36428C